jgi:ribosomal protein S18 acetylase RimI-like enzyme
MAALRLGGDHPVVTRTELDRPLLLEQQREGVNATDIQIRPLTSADAASYRYIRLAGLRDSPEAFDSTFERENAQPPAWFCDRLDSSQVFGAFCSTELLGIAGFASHEGEKEAHKGQLWGMYVRPYARKAGVGRRLVEAVIEFARQRVEVIQLAVVSDSARARWLYARLGFLEYGVERNSLKQGQQYYDVILMAMDLAPQLCARHSSPSERLVVAGDHRSSDDPLGGEGQ